MKQWFDVKAAADGSSADIYIYDLIGDWIDDLFGFDGVTTAKSFVDALGKLPDAVKKIRVHINSPGGDVFGGLTIANALRAQRTQGRSIETIIDGLAASAASVIAMGGDVVRIADNAMVMIHAPWTVAIGNAFEMRAIADRLDQIRDTLVKTYQWHSTLDDAAILALLEGEDHQGTWMSADEAIANGFATEKVEGLKAAASLDRRVVAKLSVPEKFKARVDALLQPPPVVPAAAAAEAITGVCAEAGLDLVFANTLIAAKVTAADLPARVQSEKSARATAAARATEISALCAKAKLPELAKGYIDGSMSIDAVKAHLMTVTAKLDKVEIDGNLDPAAGGTPKARINTREIYANRAKVGAG